MTLLKDTDRCYNNSYLIGKQCIAQIFLPQQYFQHFFVSEILIKCIKNLQLYDLVLFIIYRTFKPYVRSTRRGVISDSG